MAVVTFGSLPKLAAGAAQSPVYEQPRAGTTKMTVLLFSTPDDPIELWLPELRRNLPEVEIRVFQPSGG